MDGLPWWLSGKESACNAGDLGQEGCLKKSMAMHFSIFAWEIPWTDRGALQATVHKVPKSWIQLKQLSTCTHILKIFWTSLVAQMVIQETQVWSLGWEDSLKKEMSTHSVFLLGKFHGERSLAGYSPWGRNESDMAEQLTPSQTMDYRWLWCVIPCSSAVTNAPFRGNYW